MNGILGMRRVLTSPLSRAENQVEIATGSADTLMRLLSDASSMFQIESGKLGSRPSRSPWRRPSPKSSAAAGPRVGNGWNWRSICRPAGAPRRRRHASSSRCCITSPAMRSSSPNAAGSRFPCVRSASTPSGHALFSVHDTGIGMDAEAQTKLFQIFPRATVRRRGGSGTGLRLAISQRLVNRMGGHITVKANGGIEFQLRTHAPRRRPGALRSPFAGAPAAFSVLVVRDDRVNQRHQTVA